TGALVRAMVKKLEELGGTIRYESEVQSIDVERKIARGVTLKSGEHLAADVVASNADYVHTYRTLIDRRERWMHADARLALSRATSTGIARGRRSSIARSTTSSAAV